MLDNSGSTNHMTREDVHVLPTKPSWKGCDYRLDKIAISNDNSNSNPLLAHLLSYNLLLEAQLCEMGYNYLFTNEGAIVFRVEDSSIAFMIRLDGKLYLVD